MGSQTAAGSSLAISAAAPATQDTAGYTALTFTEVNQVEKLGSFGASFAKVEFQPLKGAKQKYKGSADYGALQPSIAIDSLDAGQVILQAFANRVWGQGFAFLPAPGQPASGNVTVSTQFTFKSSIANFILLRYTDASNYIFAGFRASQGGWCINKNVGGVTTVVGSVAAYTPAAGDVKVVRADANGQTITLYVDGTQVATGTVTEAALQAASTIGLYAAATGSDTTGVHFDNYSAAAL